MNLSIINKKSLVYLSVRIILLLSLILLTSPRSYSQEVKHGNDVDKWRALQIFAEQGKPDAQYLLGYGYEIGVGFTQNYREAFKWYSKAAEQGNAEAQNGLGRLFYKGNGVNQDYQQAFKWYSKASEQGLNQAQGALGIIYYEGHGVPQDYVLSHMWFNIAGVNGNENAMKGRDMVAKKMTKSQLEKAQLMAQEWIKKHSQ
ncbi:tetratricopeptide repeat protein [Legionella bononiensis]|uniref:Sel1 repeat family protein n=1 Tax=Legionella bononiensis TaxID=2793102 RepID=A0ABS1WDW7_9GAMM|nr:tetratricopeptide repeat protein [Legionella bononiensis]MBL7479572.1 sel1 repeat family protein [Legionella bononiensis]MBL7527553.1 sel1 repeat family protein [Legionella bononiensis]